MAQDFTLTQTGAQVQALLNAIQPPVQNEQPVGGLLPGVLYKLGTLTGDVTIVFASPADNAVENEYKFTFSTGAVAPTSITLPNTITDWAGNALDPVDSVPDIQASSYYEVSVVDGHAIINKFE